MQNADIHRGSSRRGRQTTVRLSTTTIFDDFGGYFFATYRDKASIFICRQTSVLASL